MKSLHDELKKHQINSRLEGRELWNCVKFTWKEPLRNEMLQEIKECNNDIAKLCASLQSAPPVRKELQKHRAEAVFRVRKQAQLLHQILLRHYTCNCPAPYEVKLCLMRCYCEPGVIDDTCFEALFLRSSSIQCQTTIRMVQEGLLPTKQPRMRIQVQAHLSESKPPRKTLQNVCAAIEDAFVNGKALELIINDNNQVWEVPQENLSKSTIPKDPKILTLQSILSESPQYLKKRWLAKEKAILAVVLAHSLLQLHESTWLRRYWTTEHISFLIDKDFTFTKSSRFALKSPYVSTLIKETALTNDAMADANQLKQIHHPIPTLMALGIVLLELHLNATITASNGSSTGDLRARALEVLDEC